MSVYSGFGTRQQESTYSKALYNTLFLLQLRIYKLFKGGKSLETSKSYKKSLIESI